MSKLGAPQKAVQRVSVPALHRYQEPLETPPTASYGAGNGYSRGDSPSFSQMMEDIDWDEALWNDPIALK